MFRRQLHCRPEVSRRTTGRCWNPPHLPILPSPHFLICIFQSSISDPFSAPPRKSPINHAFWKSSIVWTNRSSIPLSIAIPASLHSPTFVRFSQKNSNNIHLLSTQELKARQRNESRVFEFKKGSQKPQKLPLKPSFSLTPKLPPPGHRRNSDSSQYGITSLINCTQNNPSYSSFPSVFPLWPRFCIIPRVWRFRKRRSGVR
jgi:hypothetical protein